MICNSVDHPPVYNWAFISFHFVQSEYSPTFIMMMIMVMIMMMIMVMMMRMIMTTMMMMMRMKVGIGLNCNGQRCNCSGESPRFGSIIPIKLSLNCIVFQCIPVFLYFCILWLNTHQALPQLYCIVFKCISVFLYPRFGSIPIKLSFNCIVFKCISVFTLWFNTHQALPQLNWISVQCTFWVLHYISVFLSLSCVIHCISVFLSLSCACVESHRQARSALPFKYIWLYSSPKQCPQ